MDNKLLSIVVPAYNEQESLPLFYDAINNIESELKNTDIELIFIDDGSRDNTLSVIKELHKKARLTLVSSVSIREGSAHDVLTKEVE